MKITEKQLRKLVRNVVSEQAHLTPTPRPLYKIADDISSAWKNISPAAKPYLWAMMTMNTVNDGFGVEDGESIVLYFLSNASSFRGPDAVRLKAELKQALRG